MFRNFHEICKNFKALFLIFSANIMGQEKRLAYIVVGSVHVHERRALSGCNFCPFFSHRKRNFSSYGCGVVLMRNYDVEGADTREFPGIRELSAGDIRDLRRPHPDATGKWNFIICVRSSDLWLRFFSSLTSRSCTGKVRTIGRYKSNMSRREITELMNVRYVNFYTVI